MIQVINKQDNHYNPFLGVVFPSFLFIYPWNFAKSSPHIQVNLLINAYQYAKELTIIPAYMISFSYLNFCIFLQKVILVATKKLL